MKRFISVLMLVGACPNVFAVACETFTNSTPGAYSCTVSAGVTSLNFEVKGGNGGTTTDNGSTGVGGSGAKVTGSIVVNGGQTLYITVGGNGSSGNGIGLGAGSGGGGYSAISTTSYTVGPYVVAGGGGGGPYGYVNGGDAGISGGTGGGVGGAFNQAGSNGGTAANGGAGASSAGAGGASGANGSNATGSYAGGGGGGFGGIGGAGGFEDAVDFQIAHDRGDHPGADVAHG